jgi:anti-sigma regulatory factor (Ser/Thr protein kinase)
MEISGLTRRVAIRQQSDAGDARRLAARAAESARFDAGLSARVSIIAAEMTSNLLKHSAEDGKILINVLAPSTGPGSVELLAIDRGPGIANPAAALEDGYSTAGSLGVGLGAIRRQSSHFEIHSIPQRGTAMLARVSADNGRVTDRKFDVGVVSVAKDGEEVSGDGWALCEVPSGIQLFVVDGLGHGLLANDAATLAVKTFRDAAGRAPVDVLRLLHPALRSTRGATVGVATVDTHARVVTYAGIGNIGAVVVMPESSRLLVSLNGTVGREPVQYRQFETAWNPKALIVAHSDGLTTRWRLDQVPGLAAKDPTLIAAVLFRDFARELDDVTVVVAKQRTGSPPKDPHE